MNPPRAQHAKYPWSKLHRWGRLRFFQQAWVWVVFVPPIARVVNAMLDLFEARLPLHLFGLYAGSVFVAGATLLYQLFCPEIIKLYGNFEQFQRTQLPAKNLVRASRVDNEGAQRVARKVAQAEKIETDGSIEFLEQLLTNWDRPDPTLEGIAKEQGVRRAFYSLYDEAEMSCHQWRLTCTILFFIAGLILAAVAIRNFLWVIAATFPS